MIRAFSLPVHNHPNGAAGPGGGLHRGCSRGLRVRRMGASLGQYPAINCLWAIPDGSVDLVIFRASAEQAPLLQGPDADTQSGRGLFFIVKGKHGNPPLLKVALAYCP